MDKNSTRHRVNIPQAYCGKKVENSDESGSEKCVKNFVKKYGLQADEQQMKVIGGADGAVNLVATAGSGKTRTIINRIGYMVREKGIAADSVLAVTFTTAAAREMKERYIKSFGVCGGESGQRFYESEPLPLFCTINAFCAGVVRRAQRAGAIPVMNIPEEGARAFNAAVRSAYERQRGGILTDAGLSELKIAICRVKNEMLAGREKINSIKLSDELRTVNLFELYSAYNKTLYDAGYMDFDDQMRFALRCFVKFPDMLEFYRNKYKYIILDESQDTSVLQFKILKMLAAGRGGSGGAGTAREGGIMICGDDDQSIYSFRGASPDSLFDFNREYRDVKTFYLETNYRSKKSIVDGAARLISCNEKRFNKVIRAFRGDDDGGSVRTVRAADARALYELLYSDVTEYAAANAGKRVAILYKNNDSVIPLIDIFERRGARAVCRNEDFLFFSSPVAEDMRSIVRLIIDPTDGGSFMNMYYKAGGLYINKATAESWLAQIEAEGVVNTAMQRLGSEPDGRRKAERFCALMRRAKAAKPADALRMIVKDSGYENYLMKKTDSETAPRTQMRKVETLRMLAENCGSLEEFLERLDYLSSNPFLGRFGVGQIYFSTIHSAKGLEFDRVVFLDPYQDIFSYGSRKSDEEELRRLFYVGVTRAADELVFYAADGAYGSENELSDYYYEFTGKTKPSGARSTGISLEGNSRRMVSNNINITRFMNNDAGAAAELESASDRFVLGDEVVHIKYGCGIIKKLDGTRAVIVFDSQKRERIIDLAYAAAGGAIKKK